MQAILVTGGAGFIGANFVEYFALKYPQYLIVVLDKLTYAASLDNLNNCKNLNNFVFIKGDIADFQLVTELFKKYDLRGVINFAAESHVDNSINNPYIFIQSNIVGTFNLLECARQYWMIKPNLFKKGYETCRFHHISTDEVYGSLGKEGLFSEESSYKPSSPYSASKASSDHLVHSYFVTFGLNTTISNCSNNFGPYQHSEKLIPAIIKNCLEGKKIPIYGNGLNVRDWLYVKDHCIAIDLIYHQATKGSTYNIGSNNERTNLEIVNLICDLLDNVYPAKLLSSYKELITFVEDRPGHDARYAIDATKIKTELNWQAKESFENAIAKTVDWYVKAYKKLTNNKK
jgi:dTDP-glucose 4,6-dehydratase